jgi:uncharacterized protein (DUF427 family)
MSARMLELMLSGLGGLRHEPVRKRIRATLGEHTAVDTTAAMLVWEPRRIMPSYAVPLADVRAELVPADGARPDEPAGFAVGEHRVLDPSIAFAVHTTAGEPLSLRANGHTRPAAAFWPADPDLSGHVILDFDGLDAWYEEDERVYGHARDPFHGIEIRRSSREVRIELDGRLIAASSRPRLLFEGNILPVRYYLPREDICVPLQASPTRTRCPYKGEASYWTPNLRGGAMEDLAWSYQAPLPEAAEVAGLVAFFTERLDVIVDGQLQPRPHSPWA